MAKAEISIDMSHMAELLAAETETLELALEYRDICQGALDLDEEEGEGGDEEDAGS